ncbi:MAG TPA: hypothetical protein VK750_05930 [Cytophagaceae bacterium]|jgi:hypothetical protein|nr:hypothetical protein [Cytophagaceae bacterium]
MATLLQSIDSLIDNISVTDRQEESIKTSTNNITSKLELEESGLHVTDVFTNGSYERDTIIRPLNDIDLFAVLDFEKWKNENGGFPNPQTVLTNFKNYLNGIPEYKDKVSQDRPCVTIELSDKDFDVLPSFKATVGDSYYIPNSNLDGWLTSDPKTLSKDLDDAHRSYSYRLKPLVKAVKYWNRENGKKIPSFHIEEIAISIFKWKSFSNYEVAIRNWFEEAETYLNSSKFKSTNDFNDSKNLIKKTKEKIQNAKKALDEKKEGEAKKIWKEVFGKEFPAVDVEEAKNFSKSLSEGTLKVSSSVGIGTDIGKNIPASKGFFGN